MEEQFDPSELEVERDPKGGDFIARFADNRRCLQSRLLGRTARLDGLLIATVVLTRELN
jgi:hypothetical protein